MVIRNNRVIKTTALSFALKQFLTVIDNQLFNPRDHNIE